MQNTRLTFQCDLEGEQHRWTSCIVGELFNMVRLHGSILKRCSYDLANIYPSFHKTIIQIT